MARKNASDAILKAAQACLLEGDGYFEMIDVATRAGVSEGLAYHYFKSKSGLLSAVVEDFYDRYMAIANKRYDGSIPWQIRERERLQSIISFLYDDPMAPIILGKMSASPQAVAVEAKGHDELVELAGKNIRDGIKRGNIPTHIDAGLAGAAITGAVRQSVLFVMATKKRPTAEALTDQLWNLIVGALNLKAEHSN